MALPSRADPTAPTGIRPTHRHLLLVEENEPAQVTALGLLAALGFHVDLATDPDQAGEMRTTTRYDVVVRARAGAPDYEVEWEAHRDRASQQAALVRAIQRRLDDLRGPGPAGAILVERLMSSFLSRARGYLADLGEAVERGDAAAVGALAHSLNGMAGNLGATTLAALCGQLEILGRAGQVTTLADVVARLATEYARVRQAFDQIPAGAPPSHPIGTRSATPDRQNVDSDTTGRTEAAC